MHVEIKLEALTPLFLAGAAQQQQELRTASVRGELRYWYRVALGGIIGDKNIASLAEFEATLFGGTKTSSPVIVRIAQVNEKQGEAPLRPNRNGDDAAMTGAFLPGTTFHLILSLSPRGSMRQLELVTWAALLWLTLGGLGRRSRRGAGSVRVKEVIKIPDPFPPSLSNALQLAAKQADDAQALASQLQNLLTQARIALRTSVSGITPRHSSGLAAFSILRDDTRIVVKSPDEDDSLSWLMAKMSVLKAKLGSRVFAEAFGGIRSDGFGGDRRASPLHITLHKTKSGPALVFTHLEAEILRGNNGHPEQVRSFLAGLNGIAVSLTGGAQ